MEKWVHTIFLIDDSNVPSSWELIAWAFRLPDFFESGNSGNLKFGQWKLLPDISPKKHYPQFRVPDNSSLGSCIPDLPEFSENNTLHTFWIPIYI